MILLRKVRKERGVSQVKLCRMTGIAPADISQIENGWKKAYPGWRKKIAMALDVPAAEADRLFEEVDVDYETTTSSKG